MIQVIDVHKTFEAHEALRGVSLRCEQGKITALIGPSGCGKSTLLRALVGLVWPEQGTIEVGGIAVKRASINELRKRMGYVIQDGGLFPHLTGYGNVALQARSLGWGAEAVEKRVAELADLVHLSLATLSRYPTALSGGQRQRVSIMRALMLDPDILLLDEPYAALDPLIRRELQTEVRETCQKLKKTVVVVTHDLNEASYLAETIVLMRDGKIVQVGTARDLIDHPANRFVTDFVNAYRTDWGNA